MLLFCRSLYAGGLWLSFYLWSGGVPWCFCGMAHFGAFRKTRFAPRTYCSSRSFDESCVDSRHLADSSVPRPATRLAVTPSVRPHAGVYDTAGVYHPCCHPRRRRRRPHASVLLLVPGLLLFRLHACRYLGQEKTVGAASRVDAVDRHDVTASVLSLEFNPRAGALWWCALTRHTAQHQSPIL